VKHLLPIFIFNLFNIWKASPLYLFLYGFFFLKLSLFGERREGDVVSKTTFYMAFLPFFVVNQFSYFLEE